jgi:Ion channel
MNMIMKGMMRVANSPRLLMLTMFLDVVLTGLLFAAVEHHGPITSMWWAVVTGSTTGYGDQYPKTTPGRAIGVWMIVTGILLVSVAIAQLASKLIVDRNVFTNEEQEELKHNIQVIAELLTNVASRSCMCIWDDQDKPLAINPRCAVHGQNSEAVDRAEHPPTEVQPG